MLLKNIIPFVRFARHRVISPISSDAFRCVQTRDNRLFFVTDGVGKINVEGESYPLERATVALIPAGCKYSLNPDSSMKLIIINFDYTDNFSLIKQSFHPFSSDYPGALEKISFDDAPFLSQPIVLSDANVTESKLRNIANEFSEDFVWRDEHLSAYMKAVITDVVLLKSRGSDMLNSVSPLVKNIIAFLKENYAQPIDGDTLSMQFNFSVAYINRIFKKEKGVTVHKYLVQLRINIASRLLSSGEYLPTEVAAIVGFEDYPHFSKTFKQMIGVGPREYCPNKKAF